VDLSPDQAEHPTDGVLVVRTIPDGAGGRRIFRVTMGAGLGEPVVSVVAGVPALHSLIDDWVASIGS
jgi:hypothetical protein